MPRKGEIDYSVDLELDLGRCPAERRRPEASAGSDRSARARKTPFDRFSKNRSPKAATAKRATTSEQRHLGQSQRHARRRTATMVSTDQQRPGHRTGRRAQQSRNGDQPADARFGERNRRGSRRDPFAHGQSRIGHGSVLIAAITSCTNTCNPSVMLAAGLLAKKAVERGLTIDPAVKTSLAPGSRVVTDYLQKTGLQTYLDQLGFNIVGYGCTTCIGNSGPLHPTIEKAISEQRSRRRLGALRQSQFRSARPPKHQGEFPDVAAARGRVRARRPRRYRPVEGAARARTATARRLPQRYLADACRKCATRCRPRSPRKSSAGSIAISPRRIRSGTRSPRAPARSTSGTRRAITSRSRRSSRLLDGRRAASTTSTARAARHFRRLGHDRSHLAGRRDQSELARRPISRSRAGSSRRISTATARRGNDRVMTRGTFANVRIKNLMVPGSRRRRDEIFPPAPTGEQMSIYDAAMKYAEAKTPLVILAGQEYGTGSPRLGGERHAIARRESGRRGKLRAHPPLQSRRHGRAAAAIQGRDQRAIAWARRLGSLQRDRTVRCDSARADGDARDRAPTAKRETVPVKLRIDTPIEIDYYRHGGILPFVLRELLERQWS